MVDEQEFINQTILRLRSGYYIQEGGASAERDIDKLVDIGLICKAEVERLKAIITECNKTFAECLKEHMEIEDENEKLKVVVPLANYLIEDLICGRDTHLAKMNLIEFLKGLEVEK